MVQKKHKHLLPTGDQSDRAQILTNSSNLKAVVLYRSHNIDYICILQHFSHMSNVLGFEYEQEVFAYNKYYCLVIY